VIPAPTIAISLVRTAPLIRVHAPEGLEQRGGAGGVGRYSIAGRLERAGGVEGDTGCVVVPPEVA
jgi:hypothetical protein